MFTEPPIIIIINHNSNVIYFPIIICETPSYHFNTNPFFLSDDSNTWFGQFCWASKGGSMNGVVVSSVSEEVRY